jgi:hypothetical protein
MGCGCNKGAVVEPKYVWTSADGKQKVGNLNRVQANTRQNRKGGTVTPQ